MIDLMDLDRRFADHAAKIGQVNSDAWTLEAAASTSVGRPRRLVGGALVRIGEWLEGTRRAPARPGLKIYSTLDAAR